MHSFPQPLLLRLLVLAATVNPITAQSNPILTASFTWNPNCGPSVACGPSAAGYHGTGFAASNNLTYAGCTNEGGNSVDCSASNIVSGVGKGCGQCWHITPQSDSFPNNGRSVGTSVVVKINDQCTDPGYCDQTEADPVNTGYGKEVHIDLCAQSGVTSQFFGAVGPGVLVGLAQLLPDCSALDEGPYGSKLGSLDGSSSASSSSSSSSSSEAGSSSSSGSESSSSSGGGSSSGSSSNSGSGSSSSSGSESSSSSGSGSSSNSGSESSSDSGSSSSSNSESSSSSSSSSKSKKPASDSTSNSGSGSSDLGSGSRGSGNWTWSGTQAAKYKLSSVQGGPKAEVSIVNGASDEVSNAGPNNGGSPSSSPAPPTPTTLVSMVSSSTTPPPVSSSAPVVGQDDEEEEEEEGGEDCDSGDVGEL